MFAASLLGLVSLFATARHAPQAPPHPVKVHEGLQYSEASRQPRRNRLDLYLPQQVVKPALVMFVHGGAWTFGSKDRAAGLGHVMAQNGYACAVINTRQFPFARPDAMVADCGAALQFLHRAAKRYGYDGERLFVMGHSSGAHLASCLAFDQDRLAALEVPRAALAGVVLLSGVYDVRPHHPSIDKVFDVDDQQRAALSPFALVDAQDPPTFVAWAENDLSCLPLTARALTDRLRDVDVPVTARYYRNRNHVDYYFELRANGANSQRDVLQFLAAPTKPLVRKRAACTMVWVAKDERERQLGKHLGVALAAHGIEVLVDTVVDATGEQVARAYRSLRRRRRQQGASLPTHVAGIGACALAIAQAPLTRKTDALRGRVLLGCAFDHSLRDLRWLHSGAHPSDLLLMFNAQDVGEERAALNRLCTFWHHRGVDTNPIELVTASVADAISKLRSDDDLIVPMLRAYLRK